MVESIFTESEEETLGMSAKAVQCSSAAFGTGSSAFNTPNSEDCRNVAINTNAVICLSHRIAKSPIIFSALFSCDRFRNARFATRRESTRLSSFILNISQAVNKINAGRVAGAQSWWTIEKQRGHRGCGWFKMKLAQPRMGKRSNL